jgi:tetratricopeptide (TPR) repeat protein
MGEMGDDLELCKRATLRSLELSEGVITEATPENIPGNLAAFYERLGDTDNALKYYMMCLDGIKLTYPPVWADAIVYRAAILLKEKGDKRKALEILGSYHPAFRGNASSVVCISRKKGEELAEELARELGYADAQTAVNSILG